MNPLPPFALLTSHVDHQHFMIPQVEAGFRNADRASPAVNDVLLEGGIVWLKEPVQIFEIVAKAVGSVCERSDRSG